MENSLKYHIIILSKANSGNNLDRDISKVRRDRKLKNIKIYVLSDGKHPNSYKLSLNELLNKALKINEKEFDRLMRNLKK